MNTFKVIYNYKGMKTKGWNFIQNVSLQISSPEGKHITVITRCITDAVKQVGPACNLYEVNISWKKY